MTFRDADDVPHAVRSERALAPSVGAMSTSFVIAASLTSAFLFRLWVGLCIGLSHEDAKQVYLIGLKYRLSGLWPYFGADVDLAHHVQVPGALQGLIVGLPLHVARVPEVPFVLLNALSFSSLCLLAWYGARRLPCVPAPLVFAWVLTMPWTVNVSTVVYNPSYVLTGAVLFFVGALETYPATRQGLLSRPLANFMIGFGLCWVMQFHMSYVILIPYAAASMVTQWSESKSDRARTLLAFVAGAAVSGVFLVPTYHRYGLFFTGGETAAMIDPTPWLAGIRWKNAIDIPARFLSFASFETPRFVGGELETRLAFLKEFPWLSPAIVLITIVGLAQPIVMAGMAAFAQKPGCPEWRSIRSLAVTTVLLLYAGFAFSRKVPRSHTFYVTLPIAVLFGLYCWNEYLQRRRWQVAAWILIGVGLSFQTALALHESRLHSWALDRREIVRAMTAGDYEVYAARPPGVLY